MTDSLSPGVLYAQIGDELQKLGKIVDVDLETMDNDPLPYDFPKVAESISASFEMVGNMAEQAALIIYGLWDAVLESCPDNRVRHLALYAKRERARKKNIHRIFRMLERRK